jgi:hypothetical protein
VQTGAHDAGQPLQHLTDFDVGAPNPQLNRHTGITQFGGGADIRTPIRIFFPISLRLEPRDYYAVNAAN